MFTGIISDVGRLVARNGTRFRIESRYDPAGLIEGASIACDGCCLTLARLSEGAGPGAVFEMDVSNETSARTTLGAWTEGTRINLERSLSFGSELGGHLVTGHIDGLARITERRSDGESVRLSWRPQRSSPTSSRRRARSPLTEFRSPSMRSRVRASA